MSTKEWYVQLRQPSATGRRTWRLHDTIPTDAAFGRGYRAALAMKGGVSLAVWIGGAVAELDVLRRIRIRMCGGRPTGFLLLSLTGAERATVRTVVTAAQSQSHLFERACFYAHALIAAEFDEIGFDVLAGSSAGGLNAALFGVAQRAGAAMDGVIDTWVEAGSLWGLLHPAGRRGVDSVLSGDRCFWDAAFAALRSLNDGSDTRFRTAGVADRVVIELSATILDPDSTDARGTKEGQGHFRFVGGEPGRTGTLPGGAPGVELGRRIPARPSNSTAPADVESDLRRLAYAARTTSSFPGAFEPSRISSGERDGLPGDEPAPPGTVDMSFAFGAQRADSRVPYRVVDGGVTDNIPIDRALRSLRTFPDRQYSERVILYLDPSPASEHGPWWEALPLADPPNWLAGGAGTPDPQSRFIHSVVASLARRGTRESGDQERDDVEAYRRQLYGDQGRNETLAALTRAGSGKPSSWDRRSMRSAYVRYRSVADLDLLTRVCGNPSLWQLGTDLAVRRRRQPLADRSIEALTTCAIRVYNGISIGDSTAPAFVSVLSGPQARVDAAWCALAWLREVEDLAFRHDRQAAVDTAIARGTTGVRAFLVLPPEAVPLSSRADLRAGLNSALQQAIRDRDERLDTTLQAGQATQGAEAAAEVVVDAWLGAANGAAAPGARRAVDTDDGNAWWQRMDGLVAGLRAAMTALREASRAIDALERELTQTPWAGVPVGVGFRAVDLAPLTSVHGMPEPMLKLTFQTISAAEYADLSDFQQIEEGRRLSVARAALRLSDAEADVLRERDTQWASHEHVARVKLAGSTIASFGGFLNARWRRNDWWWGRIDACSGILRILQEATPKPAPGAGDARPTAAPDAADEWIGLDAGRRRAVDWLLREMNASRHRPYATPATGTGENSTPEVAAITSRMRAGAEGLADLPAAYRVATASRLIRVLSRATARGSSVPMRIAIWLLRPLLVLSPLVADPPRALVAITAITALAVSLDHPAGAFAEAASTKWVVVLVCSVPLAVGVLGIRSRHRWWRRRADLTPLGTAVAQNARRPADDAQLASVIAAGGAAAAAAGTALAHGAGAGTAALTVLEGVLVVAGIAAGRMLFRPPGRRRLVLDFLGAAASVAVLIAALCLAEPSADAVRGETAAVVLLLLGVLATHGWLWRVWPLQPHGSVVLLAVALIAVVGAASGLAVAVIDPEWSSGWHVLLAVVAGGFVWGTLMWWLGEWGWPQRDPPAEEPGSPGPPEDLPPSGDVDFVIVG